MLTRASSLIARSKMLIMLSVALASVLCFSKTSFSQNAKINFTLVSAFGVANTNPMDKHYTTYDKVLAAPKVICNDPMDEITEYDISFLPKGAEYMGPYHVKGATMTEIAMNVIKKCREEKTPTTRIFIENVTVRHNGREEKTNPVVMYCTP